MLLKVTNPSLVVPAWRDAVALLLAILHNATHFQVMQLTKRTPQPALQTGLVAHNFTQEIVVEKDPDRGTNWRLTRVAFGFVDIIKAGQCQIQSQSAAAPSFDIPISQPIEQCGFKGGHALQTQQNADEMIDEMFLQ